MPTPEDILKQYWGYAAFRGLQKEIIASVLEGKDSLALLPTGGGKSICYQVPALLNDGLCLVISPLVALMKDQVASLEKRNIPALALHSGMTYYEVRKTLQQATDENARFLYLSPERLETSLFKEYLPHLSVSLIAVDEAHCISQWGYDFRPPYLRIAALREHLPHVPILAVTASATPEVERDIAEKLLFAAPNTFRQPFTRPNISYSVFKADSKINKLQEILANVKGSAVVYCNSRRQAKEVAGLLGMQQVPATFYHAGLTQDERGSKQTAWLNGQVRVMVCTNAFGMGIDKPDVRTVVHYTPPECLENYYQEAGRAGRDGKKAYAVLLYNQQDENALEALPDTRFPDIYQVRKVYQHLADYLQVPVGIGAGNYYDFDLVEFVKNFKLEMQLAISVLKVLEQEGHLEFNESIFLPSQVCFTAPKQALEDFENSHQDLEPLIKCLLRTYEGIYDNRVSVHEKQVARLARMPVEKVISGLQKLQAFGIIEYLPQKEKPQVHFILNRAPAEFLYINREQYSLRKQQYENRLQHMLQYIGLQQQCRSSFIGNYFGDAGIQDCGVCDNCLNRKRSTLSQAEFSSIQQSIYNCLSNGGVEIKTLLQQLAGIKREKLWQVINYLQTERKIVVDELGIARMV
ncbi:RecQ family ATP-dependent DNA helicase [Foetidibacter luteolus]|uniref:RecQ family ATP-dependent DNA helicase n=1 Tax=Foetidibacter luteolus TaxID=2608880 RepID=UPI00129A66E9|nr:ATP-dependent DNA helicase RecQ [Foetidibacter luteolus]